jgi:hypothetical protein
MRIAFRKGNISGLYPYNNVFIVRRQRDDTQSDSKSCYLKLQLKTLKDIEIRLN